MNTGELRTDEDSQRYSSRTTAALWCVRVREAPTVLLSHGPSAVVRTGPYPTSYCWHHDRSCPVAVTLTHDVMDAVDLWLEARGSLLWDFTFGEIDPRPASKPVMGEGGQFATRVRSR